MLCVSYLLYNTQIFSQAPIGIEFTSSLLLPRPRVTVLSISYVEDVGEKVVQILNSQNANDVTTVSSAKCKILKNRGSIYCM